MSVPRFFSPVEAQAGAGLREGFIKCSLCPRRCVLPPGEGGQCRVRVNRDGKPALPFYGFVTALALDPIEKKPLYHFRPGTEILSAGFAGCNLHCPFCQNWHISQKADVPGRFYSPAELAAAAAKNAGAGSGAGNALVQSIAYTYSEPLVHIEFLLDCMKEARKSGAANVLVSNGCINPEAAEEVLALTDAANIDLKCFSKETYKKVLGGDLSTVLSFIRRAAEKGVHLELTTLVVPGLNDGEEELDQCRDFIAELETGSIAVPWHLSAYHPDYKWHAPPTDPRFLSAAAGRAREKLLFVYTGNVAGEKNDTPCPHCGKTLIRRRGYSVDTSGLALKDDNGKPAYFCNHCGARAPIA